MTARPAPYTAAVVQFGQEALNDPDNIGRDMAANAARMVRWIRFLCDGAASPARLIVFPIVSLVGSRHRPMPPTATPVRVDPPHDPVLQPIIEACRAYDCYVSLSVLAPLEGMKDPIHTGIILGGEGVILRQPKFQPYGHNNRPDMRALYDDYVAVYGADAVTRVVDTPIGRLGSMLDRDMLMPETGRQRAAAGADVIVHPAFAWDDTPMPYVALRQAMAFQNHLFILSSVPGFERWTQDGREVFHLSRGQSTIVGPGGEVLACCDYPGEGYALATIDLTRIDAARDANGGVTTPIWEHFEHTYRTGRT